MDETVMAGLVISRETTAAPASGNGTESQSPALSLQQLVHNAAEFGWLVAELLGRSFLLQQAKPPDLNFDGEKLVMLEGLLTPREKILSVISHMSYLAKTLGIDICTIDPPDEAQGKTFVDVISASVMLLCRGDFDASKGETFETVRGEINKRLFFWDLKINDALQNGPAVIEKAYLIGYCLGGLRWWYGLPGIQLDKGFKAKVLQYLPVIGPHLPQFAQSGLSISVAAWWDAIAMYQSTIQGTAMPASFSDSQQAEGLAPAALQKQGRIWYSLITGESDALSYVDPTIRNRPYIWQVLLMTWPLFAGGIVLLLLVIACVIYIIFSYHNQIVSAVTAGGGLLATFGIAQTLQQNAGNLLQRAVADADATIKGSYLDRVWNATLQKAVNQAVFIPPPMHEKKAGFPK